MPTRYLHTMVRVLDLDRSMAFYRLLGLEEIRRIETRMAGSGRVLIRPSGTEPLVRVMLEGEDLDEITGMAERLATLITRRMG